MRLGFSPDETIRLGLMSPLTGLVAMYGSEISLAGQVACNEVNENGGVLGKPLELIIEDDGSLPESATSAAEKLVGHHRCAAIIGNLLSNSRIAVAYRVAEPRKIPYLNFSFYEGSILSRYFFHFAALPNQQIDQMIPYMQKKHGRRMFFAGNNYEWPRGSIDAAKRALERSGGEAVGEEYFPIGVGMDDIDMLLDHVAESGAEVFVPYFAGLDQVHLLTRFAQRGLKSRIAVVMGHFDEMMASKLPAEVREGFYSTNTYFMTLDTRENSRYLERLSSMPGINGIWPAGNGILTNFGEGAYLCVKAFALAVNKAGSLDPEIIVNALETVRLTGPQGAVQMDPVTHHATVNAYLSRCRDDGTFTIVERFGAIGPVIPERYRHLQVSGNSEWDDIRLQSRMMEQMTEAVFLAEAKDGRIIYTNPGFEKMFGYGRGEVLGRQVSMLNAPSGKMPEEAAAEINRVLFQKGVWKGEVKNVKKDGTPFWSAVSVSTFTHATHGEVWMAVHNDITECKSVGDALRESEERYRLLAKNARDVIWTMDRNGRFTYVSPSVERLRGYTAAEVMRQSMRDVLTPESAKIAAEGVEYFLANGEVLKEVWEMEQNRKDGSTVWTEVITTPLRDGKGETIGLLGISRDISERKQAEETIHLMSLFPQFNPAPIIRCDSSGVIQLANPAALTAFGNTDLRGIKIQALIPELAPLDLAGIIRDDLLVYLTAPVNGEWYQFAVKGSAEMAVFNLYGSDITARKTVEDALRGAKETAEQATHLKDKFVSLVAHDLKSPLSTMLGFLHLVRDDPEDPPSDAVRLMLDSAIESGMQMAHLIDNLLAANRFRSGKLKLYKRFFDAKYLGMKMIADFSEIARQKGIELANAIPENSRIYADKTLLAEAVQNLAANAIKFCGSGDRVTFFLAEGETTTICVRDTGPGIRKEMLKNIFDHGIKTSTVGTGGEVGTGFGIPLVKEIMKLHGGELGVESEPGRGCLFSLKLPYVRPKILLVDDDRNSRRLLMELLRDMNADIIEAEDGKQALRSMSSLHPHLVITDIKMPVMDGFEFLVKLKYGSDTKDTPVIVISGVYGMEIGDTVFKLGADDFVTKKIDRNELIPRVRKHIG